MSEYQLEIKQLVDYPRCRIYREFIQSMINTHSIRISHRAGLYHYAVLCSYANFRTSYKRIEGISYTIYPGEWLCRTSEVSSWFRVARRQQLISILEELQKQHLITFNFLGRGRLVKFSIANWHRFNRVLDYNAPCQKESGFFFLPVSTANELIGNNRCSEMDALLDMWINAVYNDRQVQGSAEGPVVYIRNGTGSPLLSYNALSRRWGLSKSTVGRYLQKLQEMELIEMFSFAGTHGTAIYLKNYLSTMFEISDVLFDKEEIAMALNIMISIPEKDAKKSDVSENTSVSECSDSVSKLHIDIVLQKVLKFLTAHGFSCAACAKFRYKLLPLFSECKESGLFQNNRLPQPFLHQLLTLYCGDNTPIFCFEIYLQEVKNA